MPELDIQGEIAKVIAQLNAAVTNIGLYTAAHPQVGQYVEKTHSLLAGMLRERPEVTIMLVGNDLVAEGHPLPSDSAYIANFSRILRRKSVERLTFVVGLPREELQGFIQDLAASDAASIKTTPSIKLGKVELRVKQAGESRGWVGGDDTPIEVLEELAALTANELDQLKDVYLRIKTHKQIDVKGRSEE
ncbi:MAG: hypothetical protein HGA43_14920, partial [Nitrospirae bacterium]|nr:hypothetical protein [Nitrospirota bacterium]